MTRMLVVLALLSIAGCEQKKPQVVEPASSTADKPGDTDMRDLGDFLAKDRAGTSSSGALPPGHPPLDAAPGAASAGAQGDSKLPSGHPQLPTGHPDVGDAQMDVAPASMATLLFDPPLDWKPEPVSSGFRLSQYALPRAEGDEQDGQMVVFFFGPGQGGPVDMNIDRWKAMFTTADGKPVADEVAKIAKREINGLKVTTLDVAGNYSDPMAARSGAAPIKGEARMLAAIVETPSGNYFFKAVGLRKTVTAAADQFEKVISTVRMSPEPAKD